MWYLFIQLHQMFFYVRGMVFHMNKMIYGPCYVSLKPFWFIRFSVKELEMALWNTEDQFRCSDWYPAEISAWNPQKKIDSLNPWISLFCFEIPFGLAECLGPHPSHFSPTYSPLISLVATDNGQAISSSPKSGMKELFAAAIHSKNTAWCGVWTAFISGYFSLLDHSKQFTIQTSIHLFTHTHSCTNCGGVYGSANLL